MADLSDVMNALTSQIVAVIYPNGTSSQSANNVTTLVYPGWPVATTLNADLQAMFASVAAHAGTLAGRMHVSIYPGNVEQNITKCIDGWQPIGTASGGLQNALKEERRVKRQFIITIYAPTPSLRDLTASLIDTALCSARNLSLADGTTAQIYYVNSLLDDAPEKEYLYKRTLNFAIEYATFASQQSTLVSEVNVNVDGGFDPNNEIGRYFIPPVETSSGFALGVNLSGLEDGSNIPGSAGVDYGVPTTAELDYYKACGFTHVRLPALWDRLQPTVLGTLDPTYLGYIQTLVTYAASIGLRVLLDLAHNYGGRQISGVGHKLGDGVLMNAMFADYWTKVATAFVGNAGVLGYDIMNEPSNMPNPAAWPAAAQAAVTAIRTVDTTTTIYCEGDGYSGAGAWLVNNANLNIVDPANKLIYSAHAYLDRDSSGTYQSWVTENSVPLQSAPNIGSTHTVQIGVQRISQFVTWLKDNGFRGHIGECGWGTDQNTDPTNTNTYNANYPTDGWNVCGDETLAYCQQSGLQVSYWNGGPYSLNYFLGIEPTTVNGVTQQTKQMAVLTKYTGATGTLAAFLSGPTRGSPSTVSSQFVLDVRGFLRTPLTFTPTDNGAGGTFSQNGTTITTITIPAGFNGLASFEYTAVSTPLVARIGVTCPSSVAAPAIIGYSTKTDVFSGLTAKPVNIYSADLVYTPYLGPVLKAFQASDTAMSSPMDFYPTLLSGDGVTYTVDQSAVAAFAGTTGRILYYDQSPNANHQTIVTTDNQNGATTATTVNGVTTYTSAPLGPSLSDIPLFVPNSQNSKPVANRTNSRVDANSPLDGHTSVGWFCVAKPASVAGMQNYFGWQFIDYYAIAGDAAGDWQMSNETSQYLSLDADSGSFHSYSGGYQDGSGATWQVYRDGLLVSSATPVAASIGYRFRSNLRIGYAPFSHTYSAVLDAELFVFDRALAQADHAALHASAQSRWATPVPPAQVTGLTLGTTGATTQALSWNAAARATAYTVQYRITGSNAWTNATTSVTATNYVVTGLAALTAYDYRIIATTGYGVATPSSTVSATTTAYPAGTGLKIGDIGVNLSGLENNPYPITPSHSDMTYYASKGFTVFRVPFDQRQAMPVLGGALNNTYLAALDSTVAFATALGVKVAIDAHNYGGMAGQVTVLNDAPAGSTSVTLTAIPSSFTTGATITGAGMASNATATISNSATITVPATTADCPAGTVLTLSGSIGTTVTYAAFANFWSAMASRYVTNPLVIFDPQNEPAVASAVWASACNAVLSAIRAVETAASVSPHLVYIPFPGSSPGSAGNAGSIFIRSITDPSNHFKFELHSYNDGNGSGTSGAVSSVSCGAERIQAIVNICRLNSVKLIIGEFAVGADGYSDGHGGTVVNGLACLTNELSYVQQQADVIDTMLWWGGGDFASVLNGGYYFGIAPYNGQDTPFIAPLQAFMIGGVNYGYPQQAQAWPLTMTNATYVAASTGFGQALGPGGWGAVQSSQFEEVVTLEARITLPANAAISTNPYIIGGDGYVQGLQVNSTGHVAIIGGATSTTVINDGLPHVLRYCADGSYQYVFVDGALVLKSAYTAIGPNYPSPGFPFDVGNWKASANQVWPGTIEYAAYYGACLSTASYTPSGSPPPLTGEAGRKAYYAFDGNGIGYT